MKLEKWALMAEIIGAAAIVLSLAFVGLQVRQSNSLAATDALKEGTEIWTDAHITVFGTEESVAFFRKAMHDCEPLSKDELGRFYALLAKLISAYDNIYNQYESGRLREEVFVSIALTYYAIAGSACAHEVLSEVYIDLPPWLIRPDGIAVLAGREGEMRLPRFLAE